MNKQIEEMAIKELADGLDITMCGAEEIFTYIIKQGYQKVDKDKQVVLTKEEYDNLKLEIQKAHNKGVSIGFDMTAFKEHSIRRKAVKETAEKFEKFVEQRIAEMQGERDGYKSYCIDDKAKYDGDIISLALIEFKQELAKQYGVEIKE